MVIVLIGYMGSGKSTIGKQLSKQLHYNFVDLDDYIIAKEGHSINDIFLNKGEVYFRKQEHRYLKELLNTKQKMVLSLGGGTPCYAGNLDIICRDTVESIYLKEILFIGKQSTFWIATISLSKI